MCSFRGLQTNAKQENQKLFSYISRQKYLLIQIIPVLLKNSLDQYVSKTRMNQEGILEGCLLRWKSLKFFKLLDFGMK